MTTRSRLLDGAAIRDGEAVPAWVRDAYEAYRDVLLDPAYPCYFGTRAEARDRMRFCHLPAGDPGGLPDALRSFVAHSRAHPRQRGVLVAFFEPDGRTRTLAEDEQRFWELLDWLHERDEEPWPADVPTDPDDPAWEFCFAGDPMFAFPCSPAYRLRRSRRTGPYYMVCFQPRRVFYGVEHGSAAGRRARERIWARVRAWDAVEPHPALEHMAYGDRDMREWQQYVLPDDNAALRARCPLQPRRDR